MQRAMFDTVTEVERVVNTEDIDCDWARGGSIAVAALPVQERRLRHLLDEHRSYGFGEDDYRWLDADEARALINSRPNLGGLFSSHCAAIHPAKLASELASVVERMGVPIYEQTAVSAIEPGRVLTDHGAVRADVVVRATEAFTVDLPGHHRDFAPVYSLMIATEPLSDAVWANAGLASRPTFTDGRMMIIYGQRTADGRFAFGGRGTPYHWGSRIQPRFDRDQAVFESLADTLRRMFPDLGDVEITHEWGGAVAIPRDWYPSVGFDRAAGVAWGGGYVGDGVSTTNLAGRTIADLVLGRETDLVRLPWVGHRWGRWEPEPLRWLGVNFGRHLATSIDRAEAAGRTPRRRLKLAERLLGE
jgi:glycine/D-amino acid oxidase-like deaminating enzyme